MVNALVVCLGYTVDHERRPEGWDIALAAQFHLETRRQEEENDLHHCLFKIVPQKKQKVKIIIIIINKCINTPPSILENCLEQSFSLS